MCIRDRYDRVSTIRDLPLSYHVSCPDLHYVSMKKPSETIKSHKMSLNWCLEHTVGQVVPSTKFLDMNMSTDPNK